MELIDVLLEIEWPKLSRNKVYWGKYQTVKSLEAQVLKILNKVVGNLNIVTINQVVPIDNIYGNFWMNSKMCWLLTLWIL